METILDLKNIIEEYRVYEWAGFVQIRINNPIKLGILENGDHLVFDEKNVAHYIPKGWIHLYWLVKEGKQPFSI